MRPSPATDYREALQPGAKCYVLEGGHHINLPVIRIGTVIRVTPTQLVVTLPAWDGRPVPYRFFKRNGRQIAAGYDPHHVVHPDYGAESLAKMPGTDKPAPLTDAELYPNRGKADAPAP